MVVRPAGGPVRRNGSDQSIGPVQLIVQKLGADHWARLKKVYTIHLDYLPASWWTAKRSLLRSCPPCGNIFLAREGGNAYAHSSVENAADIGLDIIQLAVALTCIGLENELCHKFKATGGADHDNGEIKPIRTILSFGNAADGCQDRHSHTEPTW